ncbi:SGNH/GDSL hydrolase family protein [Terrabacter terrigena]|uniref:SGNH/GDSL hydrolase family protein n=1 Tax=Terrabacter terrigena TaxID=574718 RepID=A0ABW3MYP3_9MICO
MGDDFDYPNRGVRPRGPVLSALSATFPGIRAVQEQVEPYAAWWRAHNRVAARGAEPLWVALGDSMTLGIGAGAPDRGWVGQLSRRFEERGWHHRLVNLAVNGARVEDLLERQLPALADLTADGPAALVTVVAGSNDVVLRRHRRLLVQRFAELLDRLPDGAVVSNLPNPHREARDVDRMLRERAAAGRVVLVDMRREGPRSWWGRLASDRFHPNDAGMATVVERSVDRARLLGR